MKQIIHVNQHNIRHNKKQGTNLPVLTCKTYNDNTYAHQVTLEVNGVGIGVFRYSPDKPLSCGAHVWFECDSDVVKLVTLQKENKE